MTDKNGALIQLKMGSMLLRIQKKIIPAGIPVHIGCIPCSAPHKLPVFIYKRDCRAVYLELPYKFHLILAIRLSAP